MNRALFLRYVIMIARRVLCTLFSRLEMKLTLKQNKGIKDLMYLGTPA